MPFTRNLAPPNISTEFLMAVAYGLVRGYTRVAAFGYNGDVDTGTVPEDIWVVGGIYPFPAAALNMEVVSNSTADTLAGTGARTVLVVGLDANYVQVSQIINLNGTTPVALTTPLLRVNAVLIMSAGTGLVNAGQIDVRATSGGQVYSRIRPGFGIAQQAIYTVPAGFTLQVLSNFVAIVGSGSTRTVDVATYFSPNGSYYRMPLTINAQDGTPYRHDAIPGIIVNEKTDYSLRAVGVSNDNSIISAAFLGILRMNT